MEAETVEAVSEPLIETAGQLFRKKHGYSRTRAELLRKYKMTNDQYKAKRRADRKAQRKLQKDKHTKAVAQRGTATPKVHKRR